MELPQCSCRRCGYRWVPRIPNPTHCPKCHIWLVKWNESGEASAKTTSPNATTNGGDQIVNV